MNRLPDTGRRFSVGSVRTIIKKTPPVRPFSGAPGDLYIPYNIYI